MAKDSVKDKNKGKVDREKLIHAREVAQEMYANEIDSLEILEYLALAWYLTEEEEEIFEDLFEEWDEETEDEEDEEIEDWDFEIY